jgi:two-component system response regulator FlrC
MSSTPTAQAPTILVIDDDAGIAAAIKQVFALAGIKCLLGTSCRDAVEIIEDAEYLSLSIHGILADVRMPDGLGYKVIDVFRKRNPGVPAAVMTAYADNDLCNWLQKQRVPLLQKPFPVKQLLEWLQSAKTYAESCPSNTTREAESWRSKPSRTGELVR